MRSEEESAETGRHGIRTDGKSRKLADHTLHTGRRGGKQDIGQGYKPAKPSSSNARLHLLNLPYPSKQHHQHRLAGDRVGGGAAVSYSNLHARFNPQ